MICFDLFCGAGGASLGLHNAALSMGRDTAGLVAVNHWQKALDTHKVNHPWATHYQEDIRRIDPVKAMGGKRPFIGLAGPDCTHHSRARGGKPRNAGERALALDVLRWARLTEPENVLIENVPEFITWGPVDEDGKVIASQKGEYFRQYLDSWRALGYNVDWRILCAAHYGDATTRRRLFIQVRRGRITWPEASHGSSSDGGLFAPAPWKTAREIIDWNLPGESIFARKKTLAEATMARIMAGLKKFAGGPFVVPQLSGAAPRDVNEPLNTITATGTGNALVQPFLLGIGGPLGRQRPTSIDSPLGTVIGENHTYLVNAFLLRYNDDRRIQSVDDPLSTCDGSNRLALVQFLTSYYGTGGATGLDTPLATCTGKDRHALTEALLLQDKGVGIVLDIQMRMLQPHELAAAHSFPADYQLLGSKADRVKMVGNSWPVATATALCKEILQ